MNYKQGWACKKYRNKAGVKTQEDYPTAEKSWQRKTGRLHLFHVRQKMQSSLLILLIMTFCAQFKPTLSHKSQDTCNSTTLQTTPLLPRILLFVLKAAQQSQPTSCGPVHASLSSFFVHKCMYMYGMHDNKPLGFTTSDVTFQKDRASYNL